MNLKDFYSRAASNPDQAEMELRKLLREPFRISVNAQMVQNRSKTSEIMGIIVNSNEYTSEILGQDVSINPVFGI